MSEQTSIANMVVKLTPDGAATTIVGIAKEKGCSVLEATIIYMQDNQLDPDDMAGLVRGTLMDKLAEEAGDLNLLKRDSDPLILA